MSAYTSILPAPDNGGFPIFYCIPLSPPEQVETTSPLQKLKELSAEDKSTPDDDTVDDLLQFKYLDVQVNNIIMSKSKLVLRAWASSDPAAKEV